MPTVKPIPDAYPRVSPHLLIAGAAEALDLYTRVLGASERGGRFAMPRRHDRSRRDRARRLDLS